MAGTLGENVCDMAFVKVSPTSMTGGLRLGKAGWGPVLDLMFLSTMSTLARTSWLHGHVAIKLDMKF